MSTRTSTAYKYVKEHYSISKSTLVLTRTMLRTLGQEVNAEKSRYMFTSRHQIIGQHNYIKATNKSFEHVVTFKYLGTTLTIAMVAIGGLVIPCLPLDPRLAGSNPTENGGFLRAMIIRSKTSLGADVK
jgi:hypothetical protein